MTPSDVLESHEAIRWACTHLLRCNDYKIHSSDDVSNNPSEQKLCETTKQMASMIIAAEGTFGTYPELDFCRFLGFSEGKPPC
jgi:hypothetical protein